MTSGIFPGIAYEYAGTILTNTTKTACLTVGAGKAADCVWVEVLGVTVVDSTGSVATAATLALFDGTTERVLIPASIGLPNATENLEFTFDPAVHLETDGEVRVTGANGHHVHISFCKGALRGSQAQIASS